MLTCLLTCIISFIQIKPIEKLYIYISEIQSLSKNISPNSTNPHATVVVGVLMTVNLSPLDPSSGTQDLGKC